MNPRHITLAAAGLLLLGGGLLLGLLLNTGNPADSGDTAMQRPAPADTDAATVQSLQQQLQQERQARETLQGQVAALAARLDALAQRQTGAQPATAPAHGDGDASAAPAGTNRDGQWLDEQVLLQAGISSEQIATVKQQLEALEMERLYLRDRASREGWMGSSRYMEEVDKLSTRTDQIRNELGEDNYGAYLYAIGEPNQVLVESIIGGSPAEKSGLQAGDVLVSYANRRIYTWSDLREATAGGKPGEPVQLVIRRGDETLDTWIGRGPLGIRMGVRSNPP